MEIFDKSSKGKKSWSLRLDKITTKSCALSAVDSNTGEHIAFLIDFYSDGSVVTSYNAMLALQASGYDPYEHGNRFDTGGKIIIE